MELVIKFLRVMEVLLHEIAVIGSLVLSARLESQRQQQLPLRRQQQPRQQLLHARAVFTCRVSLASVALLTKSPLLVPTSARPVLQVLHLRQTNVVASNAVLENTQLPLPQFAQPVLAAPTPPLAQHLALLVQTVMNGPLLVPRVARLAQAALFPLETNVHALTASLAPTLLLPLHHVQPVHAERSPLAVQHLARHARAMNSRLLVQVLAQLAQVVPLLLLTNVHVRPVSPARTRSQHLLPARTALAAPSLLLALRAARLALRAINGLQLVQLLVRLVLEVLYLLLTNAVVLNATRAATLLPPLHLVQPVLVEQSRLLAQHLAQTAQATNGLLQVLQVARRVLVEVFPLLTNVVVLTASLVNMQLPLPLLVQPAHAARILLLALRAAQHVLRAINGLRLVPQVARLAQEVTFQLVTNAVVLNAMLALTPLLLHPFARTALAVHIRLPLLRLVQPARMVLNTRPLVHQVASPVPVALLLLATNVAAQIAQLVLMQTPLQRHVQRAK